MCSVCEMQKLGLNSCSVKVETLCDEHYFEWFEEKMMNELSADEEYFHYV
jgi:hypothetical protein